MSEVYVAGADRELRFSPEWDGESLVFDTRTSDLFVLSTPSRLILEALLEDGALDVPSLMRIICDDPADGDTELEAKVDDLLVQLADCRLVEPLCVDCCGSEPL